MAKKKTVTAKADAKNPLPRVYDVVEPDVFEFEDPELIKKRLESKAFKHVEEQLDSGSAKANALAKMILEPKHYNKAKVNVTLKLSDMNSKQLLGHMDKLLKE